MSLISPETYTDEQLRTMKCSKLEALLKSCDEWKRALRLDCREWLEYSALGGRVYAEIERRMDETMEELKAIRH